MNDFKRLRDRRGDDARFAVIGVSAGVIRGMAIPWVPPGRPSTLTEHGPALPVHHRHPVAVGDIKRDRLRIEAR